MFNNLPVTGDNSGNKEGKAMHNSLKTACFISLSFNTILQTSLPWVLWAVPPLLLQTTLKTLLDGFTVMVLHCLVMTRTGRMPSNASMC